MNEPLYVVRSRYEYRTNNGKEFTNWFLLSPEYRNETESNKFIAETKKLYADIDKKTKLNHEYELYPVEKYEQDKFELEKSVEAAQKRDEAYFASDEWKELKHKKYEARKERKAKQEEYLRIQAELQKQKENNI